MNHFLKLIRWPNLIVIIIAQLVVYTMIIKTLPQPNPWYSISWIAFVLLTIMTITAAAAGNIINDIFDVDIDKINRNDRVLANGIISIELAKKIYISFVILGSVSIGFFIYLTGLYIIGFLYLFATFFLFYYSKSLKSTPGAGNFVVSFLCAGAIAIVSWPLLFQHNISVDLITFRTDLWALIAFAFWSSMARELSKDIFDMEGDKSQNLDTIPLKFGFNKAKILLNLLLLLLLMGLSLFLYNKWPTLIPKSISHGLFLVTGFIVFATLIITHNSKKLDKKTFAIISSLLKLVMVAGTISFWLIYWLK